MSRGVNVWHGIGNLTRDPETRFTQGGSSVVNFSLAINYRKKIGEQWEDAVEYVNIVAFGKTADACGKYLEKGSAAYCSGRIQTRKWEKDGVTRYSTEVVAFDVQFLGSPKGQEGSQQNKPQEDGPRGGYHDKFPQADDGFDPNSDIPF